MKTIYKNLVCVALSTSLWLFLALPGNAQGSKPVNNGTSSGSTPAPAARPATGGGGGSGSVGIRPSSNVVAPSGFQRTNGIAPQRSGIQPPSGLNRQQGSVGGNYGFGPRQGGVANQGNAARGNFGFSPRQGGVANQGNVARGNFGYAPRQGGFANQGTAPRGNIGFAPRQGGVANQGNAGATRFGYGQRGATGGSSGGYRTMPAVGYGGYWGNHHYNYHNHGYYKTSYYPRIGYRIGILPYGYYPFYFGDFQYFYSDGYFYQYDNNVYSVVEPPIGAEVKTLPEGAQSIVINGQQYYELNGVYYMPYTKDDGSVVYQVMGKDGELNTNSTADDQQDQGPQMGDIVAQLPPDCRRITVNNQKLYVSPDGVYYQEIVDANGNKTYKIVGLPTDEQ